MGKTDNNDSVYNTFFETIENGELSHKARGDIMERIASDRAERVGQKNAPRMCGNCGKCKRCLWLDDLNRYREAAERAVVAMMERAAVLEPYYPVSCAITGLIEEFENKGHITGRVANRLRFALASRDWGRSSS